MDWGRWRAVSDGYIPAHRCERAFGGVGCWVGVRIERDIEWPGTWGKWYELLLFRLELGSRADVAGGGEYWLQATRP